MGLMLEFNTDRLQVNQIFNLLERIENKTMTMADHNSMICNELKRWQDGEIRHAYFYNFLTRYWDSLNMDGVRL